MIFLCLTVRCSDCVVQLSVDLYVGIKCLIHDIYNVQTVQKDQRLWGKNQAWEGGTAALHRCKELIM